MKKTFFLFMIWLSSPTFAAFTISTNSGFCPSISTMSQSCTEVLTSFNSCLTSAHASYSLIGCSASTVTSGTSFQKNDGAPAGVVSVSSIVGSGSAASCASGYVVNQSTNSCVTDTSVNPNVSAATILQGLIDAFTYNSALLQDGFMGALLCWVTGLTVGLLISMVRKLRP